MAECNECGHIQRRLDELTADMKELEVRIVQLERQSDVSSEQIKMVFKVLNEIKDSIKDLNDNLTKTIGQLDMRIETIESRPSNLVWGVLGAVVIAVVAAGLKAFS